MDTISRENTSMLPVGSIIVGVVALLLGGFALLQASKANKALADQQTKIDKIDTIEQAANNASAASDQNKKDIKTLQDQTQAAFNQVGGVLGELRTSVTKLEDAAKKPAAVAGKKGSKGPVVAGPDEYVVKGGDSGAKIARAHGVSLSELQQVNPGVNWNKLKIGEKIKLPAKK
ncbi:MAG TPA: LysM domain-containing protein [Opitutaceae bacterium]|nr:LysM domain-containing protein [Opitutaceae bacterium]